jgi:hypothetical protein
MRPRQAAPLAATADVLRGPGCSGSCLRLPGIGESEAATLTRFSELRPLPLPAASRNNTTAYFLLRVLNALFGGLRTRLKELFGQAINLCRKFGYLFVDAGNSIRHRCYDLKSAKEIATLRTSRAKDASLTAVLLVAFKL